MAEDPKAGPEIGVHPYVGHVLGSVVLWALALSPLIDGLAGNGDGYPRAARNGVIPGLLFGLLMYPFEEWLKRREARRKSAADPGTSSEPPPAEPRNPPRPTDSTRPPG